MYKPQRPKPEEGESEILAQEKEFLAKLRLAHAEGQASSRGTFQPAAKSVRSVVQGDTSVKEEATTSAKSKVQVLSDQAHENHSDDERDIIDEGVEEPNEVVLQNTILEKSFDVSKLMAFPSTTQSLPSVKAVGKSMFSKGIIRPRTGKSIFAQIYDEKYSSVNLPHNASPIASTENSPNQCVTGGKPVVMGDKIHPYLTGMTQAEILIEQQKLVETLDPRLIEFVRSRQTKKEVIINPKKNDSGTEESNKRPDPDIHFTDALASRSFNYLMEESDLPINPKSVIGFPGMDNLESEKLEWAGLVKEPRKPLDKLEDGESARFDFDGMLLTGKELDDVKTFEKGLHHHGQEMEKPGYTIEELLTLARSVNNQQKARALQIIGNIFSKAHTGMYDFVLEKSLFELWEYMDFVYAIRKGLDEGDRTLINESLYCLANIVYPWEEELCLDIVYSWEYSKPYPWISTKSENVTALLDPGEEEFELKDDEMLKMDLLEFFIHRSNLLDRLVYFLKGNHLSEGGVEAMLKILIRVARHSPNLLAEHELLKIIAKNYITPNWNYTSNLVPGNLQGMPLWMAFKILRILIDSSLTNACQIYKHYDIMPTVMSYLALDDWKSASAAQRPEYIVMESFRIWIAFISQGIAVDEYRSFFPVLMNFFVSYQSMDELSSFDLTHSGYVFSLLLAILKMREEAVGVKEKDKHSHWMLVKDCVEWVKRTTVKFMTIISSPHLESTYDEGALFWSLSRALLLLAESTKYESQLMSEKFKSVISLFLNSKVYTNITSQLRTHSVILSSQDTSSRYPCNFASVNALYFGGNCNPAIVFGNALPFLTSLYYLIKCGDCGIPLSTIVDNNVKDYVNDLVNSTQSKLPPSFFVRYELAIILRILELYPLNSPMRFYLAYRSASETPKCCSRLFNNLFKIALSSSCNASEMPLCHKIYGGYLLLDEVPISTDVDSSDVPKKKVKFSNDTKFMDGPVCASLLFEKWSERSIESHWILEPLHRIRTIVGSTPGFLSSNLAEIEVQCKICLQLIDKCLQQHSDFVIQTKKDFLEVYCAVCQVFLLGDPRIYIGEDTSPVLIRILHSLSNCCVLKKSANQRIFSKHNQASGLPNMFLDFYPDLLKEYAENSYFNEIFANYLMLPLRIPEDRRLRSNFWIMDNIRFFKISTSKALISIDYLTFGVEKDLALLDIYMNLLQSRKITKDHNEFLFDVITTNIKNAINDQSDDSVVHLKEAFLELKL